jgi:hypothetical protein
MAATPHIDRPAQSRPTSGPVAATCDVLTVLAATLAAVPLFLHRWVHVAVQFAARNPSRAGVLQRVSGEVDKQITAIADGEVHAAIAPTMWQDRSHIFQILFALLLLIAALVVCAPIIPARWRIRARGVACLIAVASAFVIAIAVLRITARIDALPERITAAIGRNVVLKQSLALTDTAPRVSGGPGWPVALTSAGVALVLLGTLAAFIVALRAARMPAILPREGM